MASLCPSGSRKGPHMLTPFGIRLGLGGAGVCQIDRDMMEELKQIKRQVSPKEILLVVDAMTGQEAAGARRPPP